MDNLLKTSSHCLAPCRHDCHDSTGPYRAYYCARCKEWVAICVSCDRNQHYCPLCQPIAKAERIAKANTKYRRSELGKEKRREQAARRRLRKKFTPPVGDHSSPLPPSEDKSLLPETLPEKGKQHENSFQSRSSLQKKKISQVQGKPIFCAFCFAKCDPFQRSGEIPWRREKISWLKRVRRVEKLGGSG